MKKIILVIFALLIMTVTLVYAEGFISVADAPATPDTNTLYRDNIITAWVYFDGRSTSCINGTGSNECPLTASFNIDKVIRTSAGHYDVYWKNTMSNTNYAVIATTENVTSAVQSDTGVSTSVRSTTKVAVYTAYNGAWRDSSGFSIIAMGGH